MAEHEHYLSVNIENLERVFTIEDGNTNLNFTITELNYNVVQDNVAYEIVNAETVFNFQNLDTIDNFILEEVTEEYVFQFSEIHVVNNTIDGVGGTAQSFIRLYEEVSDDVFFKGKAVEGTSEASPNWRIEKVYTNEVDQTAQIFFADGDNTYDKVWSNRSSYTYN